MTYIVSFFSVLAPMAIALVLAAGLRRFDLVGGTKAAASVASVADDVSLKILFPTFILSAFMASEANLWPQANVLIGLSVPLVCLGLSLAASRLLPTLVPIEAALASSTFGAGNRGMLMIMVLFGGVPDALTYMANFSFLDVGHAIFIIGLIPLILTILFGRFSPSPSTRGMRWLDNYLVVTLIWIAGVLVIIRLAIVEMETMRDWLHASHEWRKNLFTLLLFVSIFIKTRLTIDVTTLLRIGGVFVGLRALLLLLFIPAVYSIGSSDAFVIALVVYILAPPASILPAMVAKSAASRGVVEGVVEQTVLLNIVFVFILLSIVLAKAVTAGLQ